MTPADSDRPARLARAVAAFLLLGLVAAAPWPFGSSGPPWRLALSLCVFALASLWAGHAVLARRFSFAPDAVSLCLLGLVLLTAAQLVPLPASVVRVLSPRAAEWRSTLLPETPELLPGETDAAVAARPRWQPLSAAPAATEDLLARYLAALLVYAAARNFLAPSGGVVFARRLAWVAFAAGVGLAALGLAQFLSGERTRVYWRFWSGANSFGPFGNKNHFAYQVNLFAGLAGGLFAAIAARPGAWRSPAAPALLGGLGLMAAAVAMCQSRGGLLAALVAAALVALVAWVGRRGREPGGARVGLVLALGVALVGGGLVAWLGWREAVERFATLWGDHTRTESWASVLPLVRQYPLTGVGGGALLWAEPTVRTAPDTSYEYNTLDNEYLEALVEGGPVRLALTLGLAVAAVWGAASAYRRTGDPLCLGCAFGLTAVAVQSIGDFGLHTPSVALAAAVAAALPRAWTGGRRRIEGEAGVWLAAGVLLVAGLVVVVAEWRVHRVTKLRDAAAVAYRTSDAIRVLEAATRARPNDPRVWLDLLNAHLRAVAEEQQAAVAAVAGPAALMAAPDTPPAGEPHGHLLAALRAARAFRDLQPLDAVGHLTLGQFADRLPRSEPPAVHFARAKAAAAYDPDVWFTTGRFSADRGDWPAALADWRESLARSPKRLAPIVARAAPRFTPDELRDRLLPDDPAVWLKATPHVFPLADAPGRVAWFRATADRWAAGPEPVTLDGFAGWAAALRGAGDAAAEERVWRRAVERFSDESLPRDRLAETLEADERYADALPLLEWLAARRPDLDDYRDRLAAARHALKLKADIDRP